MANYGDIPSNIGMSAGMSIRRNAANTAFESYFPFSHSFYDLIELPSLQADWNQVDTGAFDYVKNKPTIPTAKRSETYLGSSNSSGNYTVSYATAFTATPDVQPQLQAGTPTQTIRITASSTTGFTVNVQSRTDVIGLLPSYANVNGASVGVLVTER